MLADSYQTPSTSGYPNNEGNPTTPTSSRQPRSAPSLITADARQRKRADLFDPVFIRLTSSDPPRRKSPKFPLLPTAISNTSDGILGNFLPEYDWMDRSSYFDQIFDVLQDLGYGVYGVTRLVRRRRTGELFAVKYNPAGKVPTFMTPGDSTMLRNEILLHEALPEHPNIVKFIFGWEQNGSCHLLMEFCEKCSLHRFLAPKTTISNVKLWSFFIDILLGIRHIHSVGGVHRDIKPANIMLTKDDICKVGDFGLLLLPEVIKGIKNHGSCEEGDGKYLAPEALESSCTAASDMFSLGMTLLELAAIHSLPNRFSEIWENGAPMQKWLRGIHPDFVRIICDLTNKDPARRPTAAELLITPKVRNRMNTRQRHVSRTFPIVDNKLKTKLQFEELKEMFENTLAVPFACSDVGLSSTTKKRKRKVQSMTKG